MKQNVNGMATVTAQINELKEHAKKHGLTVRFRDHKTDQGDFCIFIYDPNFRKSYAVGYDGDWQSKAVSFEKCLKSAYNWIERRDKRFTFRDNRWQYGRYHLITWHKERGYSDREHVLTMEDAKEHAREYLAAGCIVRVYDTTPTGGVGKLVKIFDQVFTNGRKPNEYEQKNNG